MDSINDKMSMGDKIENVYVYEIDLKVTNVPSLVTKNEDGSYSIFLNSRMSAESQKDGYLHEINHLLAEDFGKDENATKIESRCHCLG